MAALVAMLLLFVAALINVVYAIGAWRANDLAGATWNAVVSVMFLALGWLIWHANRRE